MSNSSESVIEINVTVDPYLKFKLLLNEHHEFPGVYLHKFIGKNTPEFLKSVSDFESKFIGLKKVGEKKSASEKHLSLTYEYMAVNAEDVVELSVQCHKIQDLIYIL